MAGRSKHLIGMGAVMGVLVAGAVAAPASQAAGTGLANYSNGFEQNTNGWYEADRVASGATGYDYADGISAASGSWYARECDGCDESYTFYGNDDTVPPMPPNGFTTSLDIYLDTAWAASNPDKRFDWDNALSRADGSFLQDYSFNATTSTTDWTPVGFVINASTNAGRGNANPESPCPSPSTSPNSCRTPVTITTSGWYRFVHRFYDDHGNLAVEMSILDASGTLVPGADWTIFPDPDGAPMSFGDAGGPEYGWLFGEINQMAFDNSSLTVAPVKDADCADGLLPAGTYKNVKAFAGCELDSNDNILGNVTVVSGGSLWDRGAPIGGNLHSDKATFIGVGYGGHVGGNIEINGTTGVPDTGDNPNDDNYLCNTVVDGNVQVHGNQAPFSIGASPDCTHALTVGHNLEVQGNKATLTIGDNSVDGNISVSGNTGSSSSTLTNNTAGGNCELKGNNPDIVGSGNTAAKHNTCNANA